MRVSLSKVRGQMMRRPVLISILAASLAAGPALPASAPADPPPLRKGIVEHVKTELVLLDVVVLDLAGKIVSGLTRDDFNLVVDGKDVPLVAVDAVDGTSEKPSLTLLFDYQHLAPADRGRAIEMARRTIADGSADGSPVMVGALTGSLRIEQGFSADERQIGAALTAMERDPSLFAAIFPHHDEDGFVAGMTSLIDLLGMSKGPKAVVLYSKMKDLPLEDQFEQLAADAAASRCTIYPVSVQGLDEPDLPPPPPPPPTKWDPAVPSPPTVLPWLPEPSAGCG